MISCRMKMKKDVGVGKFFCTKVEKKFHIIFAESFMMKFTSKCCGVFIELHVLRKGQLMGVPSLNDLAVDGTLNTTNQPTNIKMLYRTIGIWQASHYTIFVVKQIRLDCKLKIV